MTDVLYHPLIDRDTAGLDKSPLFCSPDREKVAGTAAGRPNGRAAPLRAS